MDNMKKIRLVSGVIDIRLLGENKGLIETCFGKLPFGGYWGESKGHTLEFWSDNIADAIKIMRANPDTFVGPYEGKLYICRNDLTGAPVGLPHP